MRDVPLRWPVVLLLLAAMTVQASAEPIRVGKAGGDAFSFVPVDIGTEIGIFARHGLQPEIAAFGGSAKVQQAMAVDAIDIGLAGGPDLAFIAKGSPVKGVAAMAGRPLLLVIVVRPDGSVSGVDDLKGRRVAVSTAGSLTNWLVAELARQHGWGSDGIPLTSIGDNAGRAAALRSHAVDAGVMDLATALNMQKLGQGRILTGFGDLVHDFHIHVIFATDKIIAGNPRAVRDFLAAWFETIAWMRAHRAETVRLSAPVMGVDAAISGEVYDALMPMFSDTGRFEPKAMAVLQRSWVELGTLPSAPDTATLVDERFLPTRE
jgi:NitT/TauT family transport system substrate-binding protein